MTRPGLAPGGRWRWVVFVLCGLASILLGFIASRANQTSGERFDSAALGLEPWDESAEPPTAATEATCSVSPGFGIVGDPCGMWHTPDQPCGCNETLSCDSAPVPSGEERRWAFEVRRTSPAGTVTYQGKRMAVGCVGTDDEDRCIAWAPTPWWEPPWDSRPFPHLNKVYIYEFRVCRCDGQYDVLGRADLLCRGAETCSVGWSNAVQYQRGEWWWCDPRNTPSCVVAMP